MNSTKSDLIFDSPLANRLLHEWKQDSEEDFMNNESIEKFQEILATLKKEEWRWNESLTTEFHDVRFMHNRRTVVFHPQYAISTAAVFGERSLSASAIVYWEVKVPALYGTSMMFGMGCVPAPTHLPYDFRHLLGISDKSFGLAHNGRLYGGLRGGGMDGDGRYYCEPMMEEPLTVGMLFHGPDGWLAYFLNGRPCGVAFVGIDTSVWKYYPMVSSTSQHSEFTLGRQCSIYVPLTLGRICMQRAVQQMTSFDSSDHDGNIDRLLQQLPARLRTGILELLRKQWAIKQQQHQQLVFHVNEDCNSPQVQSNMTSKNCGSRSSEDADELYAKLCQYFKGVVA